MTSTAVYVITDDHRPGWTKVGIASDLDQRMRAHRTTAPAIRVAAVWDCDSRELARGLERTALGLCRDMPGVEVLQEWAKVPAGVLIEALEDHLAPA